MPNLYLTGWIGQIIVRLSRPLGPTYYDVCSPLLSLSFLCLNAGVLFLYVNFEIFVVVSQRKSRFPLVFVYLNVDVDLDMIVFVA